jgi:hypothetical protein
MAPFVHTDCTHNGEVIDPATADDPRPSAVVVPRRAVAGRPSTDFRNVDGHADASRPKRFRFSSCMRQGAIPTIPVPTYGENCVGEAEPDGLASYSGVVAVGGQDCSTVGPPACVPLTADAWHVPILHGYVWSKPPRVSLSGDIYAARSEIRVDATLIPVP